MSAQPEKPKQHFNARVANQLAQQLRDGTAPMQRPGVQDIPYNPATGRTFHGINALNLMMQDRKDDRWFTFDDANLNGYKVKSGEKATPVQYWPKKRPGETMNRAITAYVFNAEQLDRVPPPTRKSERQDPMERVGELLRNSGMTIVHDQTERSFYAPRKDEIHLPKPENCASPEKYCEMAVYEYFKASGHPSRQDRDTFNAMGAADRAKEEFVCAVATMMYCAEIGIPHDPTRNPDLALDWAKSMERHPFELAQATRDADNAVWGTLRQEQARDIALGLRHNEVWRPVPETSPTVAVESFLNRNATLELADTEPWKTHGFEYQGQQLYALPDTESILSKQIGEENQTLVKAHTEAFDRDGNAYNVVMEYSAVYGEDGKKRLTDPAQAVEIVPAAKTMTLPMDWDGTLEVRGCMEDMDGGVYSEPNLEQAQFFGVYANTKSGEHQHLADFDTEEYATRYAALIDREYDRQTKREREPAQDRQQTRVQEQTISARDECIAAMRSVGMIVTGEHPIFDKKPHRIEVDGDKKGELSGFYVAHPDGRPSGYCKNNRTGEEKRWSVKGYILDDKQKKALHEQAKENVAKRDDALKAQHDKTAKRLQNQVQRLTTPQEPTPYMKTKEIQLHPGVYQNGNSTCIPLYNTNGEIRSMAYVQEDGTKRYAKNSEKEGCFHIVGGMDALRKAPAIVISEGFATAATISESIGQPAVAAMDAGNVMDVAKALREAYPDKPIIIAGDNDAKLEAEKGMNPGKSYALQAAEAVNGVAVFPKFGADGSASKQRTDFNDLARMHGDLGKDAVKSQLQPVIEKAIAKDKEKTREAKVEKTRGQKELVRG
ncbi:MAG: ssDNA-binding domain-containing protein [Planctomycetaceae bacterium]|nr:ssDNA-binding domain-containing protein [Planctomycetaceae bacterium]